MPYDVYVGVVGGISFIEITKSPIANLDISDAKGRKFALGFQTGFEYPLENNLKFFTQYQYLKAEHKTNIHSKTANAQTMRDNYSNISFGLRWNF